MFKVSDRWRRAVTYGARSGSEIISYVDIVDEAGQYVISNLSVTGGSTTVDRTRANRRECSITIQDSSGSLVPNEVDDILQPYSGYFMQLYRGFRYRDGEEEVCPLGTFGPWDPKVSETADSLQITVQGFDRSKVISRLRWTDPYVIPAGTNAAQAIQDAVLSRMSNVTMSLAPTSSTVPLTTFGVERDNDPWKDITGLATSNGMDLYFDANDVLRLEPAADDPDVAEEVAAYVDDETCTVVKFDRSNDASQQYTGVIVTGEGSGVSVPIRAEIWRTDTSLRIPYFLSSTLITTYAQAVNAGIAQLRKVAREEISVSLTAVPDPALEVDDVIRITSARSKIDDRFIVSSMSMPLDAEGQMGLATSQRRAS